MKRREFNKNTILGALGITAFGGSSLAFSTKQPRLVKPTPLRQGDTIGLIAPSSPFDEERYERAKTNIKELGFKLKEGRHLHKEKGYLAGTDQQRLEDLHRMFDDRKIRGIWCIRGGYGSTRMLNKIDFSLIAANPKVFLGYSDITALHNAIMCKTGLATFHGPVAATKMNEYNVDHLMPLISDSGHFPFTISSASENVERGKEEEIYEEVTISGGRAIGKLTGGNLTLLSALVGTGYLDSFSEKIVFLEDINEPPYKVDRMLTHLLNATDLKKAAGIALGIFTGCEARPNSWSLTLRETIVDRLSNLGIPVVYGLSFGHIDYQFTLPMGIHAELNADEVT
ncbi:MAG: LD-carboxypeptidase, partial [Saprospirales bacterium]